MNNFVAPSLLAADKTKLLDEIKLVENEGCEYLHWDVMDGVFVPNTSYTVEDVSSFAKKHKMINDVHIMVANPKEEAIKFAKSCLHAALKDTEEIVDNNQKDIILICQMIKDNLSLWKNEMPEELNML